MNEKELGELRRRFKADKRAITHVRGCYVNGKKEIVSQFNQSLALMSEEESEKLLARRGEKPVDKDGEHRVRVGDSAAEHDAREGAREVRSAVDHGEREHRKRRSLARLLLAAQRAMALYELRLRPDADRRDDGEEDYVKPARAA